MSSKNRRLGKEFQDLQVSLQEKNKDKEKDDKLQCLSDVQLVDNDMHFWKVMIQPDQPPFNKGSFLIEVTFPAEYPFKPPKINFITKIYHPNIDEKGQVCLPIISAEMWKPATKTIQVLYALIELIAAPEPDHPLRGDLAEEFVTDRKKFMKNAEDFTKKYAEKK